jgi:tetratricopeptide (TPR) repeat protein
MLHGIIDDFDTWDPGLDLLPEALEAYPDDSEILLGAGARYELLWWRLSENSHRDLVGGQFSSRDRLVRASGYLRRSIAANPAESEARLRLARVLAELGEYREGLAVIAGDDWKSDSVFEYLARMVEGDVYERLGDSGAAAATYDKAIPLVRVPQSARMAKAFLEHQSGARQEAVEEVLRATSLPLDENDPWWVYLRGQLWRRDRYLKRLREMVQP